MARHVRNRFESRTARLKLAIRKKPYSGPALGNGVTLLYRRNSGNGTWVVKAPNGKGGYWTKAISPADDYAEAGGEIVTYFAAQERAEALAHGSDSDTVRRADHGQRGTRRLRKGFESPQRQSTPSPRRHQMRRPTNPDPTGPGR